MDNTAWDCLGSEKVEVGDRIRCLRRLRKLTQERMAELCGVSRQTVQKWESGESAPVYKHIRMLREHLGVSADYILFGADWVPKSSPIRTSNAPADAGALHAQYLFLVSMKLNKDRLLKEGMLC